MMTRLLNLIGIGRVTMVDDTGEVQQMQITEGASGSGFADRILDNVCRILNFGFTSVPPEGSEAVMVRRGGSRAVSIVIATNHRPSRPTGLQPGDSAMYDVRGMIIKMTADGIVIEGKGLPITLRDTSGVHIEGKLTVDDDIIGLHGGSPLALSTIRSKFNAHGHGGISRGSATSDPANDTL
jgi:phage baseplate assembly protein V